VATRAGHGIGGTIRDALLFARPQKAFATQIAVESWLEDMMLGWRGIKRQDPSRTLDDTKSWHPNINRRSAREISFAAQNLRTSVRCRDNYSKPKIPRDSILPSTTYASRLESPGMARHELKWLWMSGGQLQRLFKG
jgi:hypothetical protein